MMKHLIIQFVTTDALHALDQNQLQENVAVGFRVIYVI